LRSKTAVKMMVLLNVSHVVWYKSRKIWLLGLQWWQKYFDCHYHPIQCSGICSCSSRIFCARQETM